MRLIDVEPLYDKLEDYYKSSCGKAHEMARNCLDAVCDMPTVDAAPLDKLCLLLHDIAGCPCNTQPGEDMCNRLIGDYCNTEWDDIECWKQFLTKWMEGLDGSESMVQKT